MDLPPPNLPAPGVLANLSDEERTGLRDLGTIHRIKTGEILIREGYEQNRLYVVVSGSLSIRRTNARDTIAQMAAGDSIGEINIFDPDVASAAVIANEDSVVWGIERDGLTQFFNSMSDGGIRLLVGLLTTLSHRISAANLRLAEARTNAPSAPAGEKWVG